jgi:hypothetical protein
MMMTKIALQITIDSPCRRATDDMKKDLIINGKTGEITQMEEKSEVYEKGLSINDLLKRSDEIVDTVTISSSRTHLLPPLDQPRLFLLSSQQTKHRPT